MDSILAVESKKKVGKETSQAGGSMARIEGMRLKTM